MASLAKLPHGRWRLLFRTDGNRRCLRLPPCRRRIAERVRYEVEEILSSLSLGLSPPQTSIAWLAACDQTMRARMLACGLPAQAICTTLGHACQAAFTLRQIKPQTRLAYSYGSGALLAHFGPSRDVRSLTPSDALAFRDHLRGLGLADATVRRRCGVARDILSWCEKSAIIGKNPFAALPTAVHGNAQRSRLITADEVRRLAAAAPDGQWRLLLALARWGALRIPSEPAGLTWAMVEWGDPATPGRLHVRSPKTEHHEGHAGRTIPLFPQIREPAEELFSTITPRAEDPVLPICRQGGAAVRRQLLRIADRAGVTLGPKFFSNCRATRDAELRRDYPAHVVCQWIGHTERIAQEHYLLATDEDYLRRAGQPVAAPAASPALERSLP